MQENTFNIQQKKDLLKHLKKEISDKKVLKAIEQVPREEFFRKNSKEYSYINSPFSIGYGQTISQPYIVALMTQLLQLKDTDKVLDIGTGSGYQAAILSRICKEVVSIEIIEKLHIKAKKTLENLGYRNIKCVLGNGVEGYEKDSPYDKILCAAAYPEIPPKWLEQLKDRGIIVFPLKKEYSQELVTVTKIGDSIDVQNHGGVVFVPLVEK